MVNRGKEHLSLKKPEIQHREKQSGYQADVKASAKITTDSYAVVPEKKKKTRSLIRKKRNL